MKGPISENSSAVNMLRTPTWNHHDIIGSSMIGIKQTEENTKSHI